VIHAITRVASVVVIAGSAVVAMAATHPFIAWFWSSVCVAGSSSINVCLLCCYDIQNIYGFTDQQVNACIVGCLNAFD